MTDAIFDARTLEEAQTVLESTAEKAEKEWKVIEEAIQQREPEEI